MRFIQAGLGPVPITLRHNQERKQRVERLLKSEMEVRGGEESEARNESRVEEEKGREQEIKQPIKREAI